MVASAFKSLAKCIKNSINMLLFFHIQSAKGKLKSNSRTPLSYPPNPDAWTG
jgi:hypothetical protein